MERISLNPYGRQFLVGYLDPGFITVGIQLRLDMQPGLGLRVPDQVDDHGATQQRLAAPVLRDMANHPVLDLVPFTGAGREVTVTVVPKLVDAPKGSARWTQTPSEE